LRTGAIVREIGGSSLAFAARLAALALLPALLAACAAPPPPAVPANPFAGAWTTPGHQQVAFRSDTLVLRPPDMPPTAMSAATCDGRFGFAYRRESRTRLLMLAPRQPGVTRRLAALLVRPDYPVAEVTCGDGDSTYVLLDRGDLVAIHRDRDIAGLERLTRL
jgi:hypothetical protein